MKSTHPPFNDEQTAALRRTRLHWLIALLLCLPLPFVALPIVGSAWMQEEPGGAASRAIMMSLLIGGGLILAGLFARNQAYKRHWVGEVITPAGYVKGNTLLFVAIDLGAVGVCLLSIFGAYPAPVFAGAPVFAALLAINFPNGAPMRPAPPRLGDEGDRL